MMIKPSLLDPALDALIRRACAAFDALSPAEQAAHRRAQRRSWVIGEMLIEHPDMTRAAVERILDDIDGQS